MGKQYRFVGDTAAQFAKDVQSILHDAAGVPVYEREAPRDEAGAVSVSPPFVVYHLYQRSPADEAEEFTTDLFIDVWSRSGSWEECFVIAGAVDEDLDGAAYRMTSGVICADRSGVVFQRMERDPDDERIRRMQGQYLLRFNPDSFK